MFLPFWPDCILKFHRRNCRYLQKIGMLGDPNSSCCSAIPKGQTGKGKYTELIQCYSREKLQKVYVYTVIATLRFLNLVWSVLRFCFKSNKRSGTFKLPEKNFTFLSFSRKQQKNVFDFTLNCGFDLKVTKNLALESYQKKTSHFYLSHANTKRNAFDFTLICALPFLLFS